MIGRTIGNYRIEKKIGTGGVGEVFRATDLALGRTVAIKALRPELSAREQLLKRFRAEAKTLARLTHPNIAMLYAFIEEDGLFMVMEYVKGRTLSSVIRTAGKMQPESALALFSQALDGLGYAHDLGVIHRDVKGSNLMVDAGFRIKIMDFGIARVVGSAHMTRVGNLVGTPEYMAPEQIRGGDATTRSDIYSTGILLYHMLCGRVPFRAQGDFETMRSQVDDPPPRLREFTPELPVAIEEVVLRALAKNPDDRFESTQDFAAALREAYALAGRERNWNETRRMAAPRGLAPVDTEAPTAVPGAEPAQAEATQVIPDGLKRRLGEAWERIAAEKHRFSDVRKSTWIAGASLFALLTLAVATNRIATVSDERAALPPPSTNGSRDAAYTWIQDASEVTVVPFSAATIAEQPEPAPTQPPVAAERQRPRKPAAVRKAPSSEADKAGGWSVRR